MPRIRMAERNSRRRPRASIAVVAIIQSAAKPTIRATAGRLREGDAEMNIALVGVPTREIVRLSVLLWEGLSWGGLKVQVSQLGSAAFVSAFRQEKLIRPEKPLGFTVTVKFADVLDADKLAVVGETEPVGKFVVAKSISATALPLAWLTHTISGVEFASTPSWTVPQVVTSGVVGAVGGVVPCGGGGAS